MTRAKAESVTETGDADGFELPVGFRSEMTHAGATRLVISVPTERLPEAHRMLLDRLKPPLGVLYRRKVDRLASDPQTAPEADFVALELSREEVAKALAACAGLIWHDARHELWLRGAFQEQVVLDQDGLLYCYPDDPIFRDALEEAGINEVPDLETLADRDYVKHWYEPAHDGLETQLISMLGLAEVPVQR